MTGQMKTHELDRAFIEVGEQNQKRKIAYLLSPNGQTENSEKTAVMWFTGFRSTMNGKKAEAVQTYASLNNICFLRFDYSGHGESEGSFEEGTISRWIEEALVVLEKSLIKNVIFVGSSMGGWIALRVAQILRQKNSPIHIKGLVLLAPAVHMTERLIWQRFSQELQEELMTIGAVEVPYQSDGKTEFITITKELIEDGRKHFLYKEPFSLSTVIHIIQGKQDQQVPWEMALELFEHCAGDQVQLTFIEDAGHSLDREEDIQKIVHTVENISLEY